jgi:hypothetical protein
LRFNHPSLRDICKLIELPFEDNLRNLITRCLMDTTCLPHLKATLAIRCHGDSAGVWKCFRCERSGRIDELVRAWTGWGVFETARFLAAHQAYDDPHDDVDRVYEPVTADELRQYQYRHQYCYERKLDESTCLRYKLGFDQDSWMITIPVYGSDGALVAIKKRSVTTKTYIYLPASDYFLTIFGLNFVPVHSIVWLCEGEFDAMYVDQTLRRFGFGNQAALSIMGKKLPERLLPELTAKQPILFVDALDNDHEGREASQRLQAMLTSIAPCMRMRYEDEQTKDPNDSSEMHLAQQARRAQSLALQEGDIACLSV